MEVEGEVGGGGGGRRVKEGGGREWRDRGRRADGKMEGVDVAKTKKQTLLTLSPTPAA